MKVPYLGNQKQIILEIINKYCPDTEVLIFGSRLKGNFKPTSDLDLCIKGIKPIELSTWSRLEEELSKTDIPFKIDLVDWFRVSDEFKKIIETESQKFI